MIDVQRYLPAAQRAQVVISQVLDNRPGTHSDYVQGWVLRGTQQNDVIFYAVLDAQRIPRPDPFEQATHHISSALRGTPVYWGNSTGFRYAVVLSPIKRLPKQIDLPTALPAGRLLIGQRVDGQQAGGKWGDLRHIIVVGMTGSGKSVTTRSIVYQAIKQDFHLVLADLDGTTFPMLAQHPNLLTPLANSPSEFISALQAALGELEHRSVLYKSAATFPENIDEYNVFAAANGKEPLKRVLIALDEYNSAVTKNGGPNGDLSRLAIELASRGRKFGISLALSAQEFSREIIGSVRDEIGVIIAHKVVSDGVARNVGVAAAAQISDRSPGRAITNRWGQVQSYYLDKSHLTRMALNEPIGNGLSDDENTIAWRAVSETGGKISLEVLTSFGMGQYPARRLQESWTMRGWAAKDPARQNGLYVTAKLPISSILATNLQTQQTATNWPTNLQTGSTNLQTDLQTTQTYSDEQMGDM